MSEPDYPEYEGLLAAVRTQSPFIDPREIERCREVIRRRGLDWCIAVLGRSVSGDLRSMSTIESRLLVLADSADVSPALPEHILAERARAEIDQEQLRQQYEQLRIKDAQRWEQALSTATIAFEVRANTQGRRYGTGLLTGPLLHVVPLVAATSGKRKHLPGQPLCETPDRHKPRVLGSAVDQPATCVQCVRYLSIAKEA